ncbi:2'-5' RNA ligase [Salinarchaeum sp. Harcht-Bsk1]|uniref:RNA 2',3'-cyclic phosphodiesterase n=1 Tax=Salinarchaeum sp. Harcht-Bsk1 TaxID=1333523 RepID=UPI0003423DA8|nr:RNA 2',3'-cyclic phosphodiesterase [Salinarchaeum sp. Harcht-Bsk1]AGN01619.1 2'-5' RNA ligase [Salinarchaeum sp. Harcht-Bsk1]
MRLFVSVDLPEDLADAVADVQEPFGEASGVRLIDPEQAHVTLKFLGDVPETTAGDDPDLDATVDAIAAGVADADVGSFEVGVRGLGAFPSPEYIRVLWVGIDEGAGELLALQRAIEERTVGLGFDPEEHEFTPHVTIGRMDHAGGKGHVQSVLEERSPDVGTFEVDAVTLTESTLEDDGPVYETVESFPL